MEQGVEVFLVAGGDLDDAVASVAGVRLHNHIPPELLDDPPEPFRVSGDVGFGDDVGEVEVVELIRGFHNPHWVVNEEYPVPEDLEVTRHLEVERRIFSQEDDIEVLKGNGVRGLRAPCLLDRFPISLHPEGSGNGYPPHPGHDPVRPNVEVVGLQKENLMAPFVALGHEGHGGLETGVDRFQGVHDEGNFHEQVTSQVVEV